MNWEPRAGETPGSCGTVLGLLKLASPGSVLGPGFIGSSGSLMPQELPGLLELPGSAGDGRG